MQKNSTVKLSGVISGLLFILAFFTMPIMSGCNGGQIIEMAADSGDPEDVFLIILMILVLVCAAIGAVMYLQDKYKQGSVAGMIGIVGVVLALIVQGANPLKLQYGGWICVLALIVMIIAPKFSVADAAPPPQQE